MRYNMLYMCTVCGCVEFIKLLSNKQMGPAFADRWNNREIADSDVPDTTTSTVASFGQLAATAGVEHHDSEFTQCYSFFESYTHGLL